MRELGSPRPESAFPPKVPTGISGLDEITRGGFPSQRTTLVRGGPGCGKTILALGFVAGGIREGEPGIFVTLDQARDHIVIDALSMGHDLAALEQNNLLALHAVDILATEVSEVGVYTLDGLLMAIDRSVKRIGAKRLVIDGLDAVFARLQDLSQVRSELVRLTREFSARGLTTLLTTGLHMGDRLMEEYVADCVVSLDHRVTDQISTRRLRVMKCRGTAHGADEYPFSITPRGIRVDPITSTSLDYRASEEMVSLGVSDLDDMLGGQGVFKGSTVLLAGEAGTGKTTLACFAAVSAATAGQRCLLVSFEESPRQIRRNMGSVGLNVAAAEDAGRMQLVALRPSFQGLEQHLASLQDWALGQQADLVVIDPVTNLVGAGTGPAVKAMLTRFLDSLKTQQVTSILTSLIEQGDQSLGPDIGISSLADTIIRLENRVGSRRQRRFLSIRKARGLAHSHEIREMAITASGISLPIPGGEGDPA